MLTAKALELLCLEGIATHLFSVTAEIHLKDRQAHL